MLSNAELQALFAHRAGDAWLKLRDAVRDNDIDGRILSEHMESPASLAEFFRVELECAITPFIAKQFHQQLLAATFESKGQAGGETASTRAPDAMATSEPAAIVRRCSFCVVHSLCF